LTHGVYLDVVAITRENDGYQLQGVGRLVEYAVKMKQLPDEALPVRRLLSNKLGTADIDSLARILSRFHRDAGTGSEIDALGSWQTVRMDCEEYLTQTEEFIGDILDPGMYRVIIARSLLQAYINNLHFSSMV
jgi:aminoglycoside phosphotransferase family enzyme